MRPRPIGDFNVFGHLPPLPQDEGEVQQGDAVQADPAEEKGPKKISTN